MSYRTCPHPGGIALTKSAVEKAALPCGSRILDVGCGDGTSLSFLRKSGYTTFGVDRRTGARGMVCGDIVALPLSGGVFDALLAECVLSVCTDIDHAVSEFRRVLKVGGIVIINDLYRVNRENDESENLSTGMTFLSLDEMKSLFTEKGFRIRSVDDKSESLRMLVFQMLWEYGSLEPLGLKNGLKGTGIIGYYLLIAEAV